jgi:hypothetical protein
LRRAAQTERELARVDYLTGAVNPRFFYPMTANNGMVATMHCRRYLYLNKTVYGDIRRSFFQGMATLGKPSFH